MRQRGGICGLVLFLSSASAQGAAVVDAELGRLDAQRYAARDTRDLKIILETDRPDVGGSIAQARSFAHLQHRVGNRLQFAVPPGRVEEFAAALPAGSILRLPYPHQAHVTSQGVTLTGAADMHALNARAAGVKIGIIDLGFASLATSQSTGELPANAVVTDYTGTGATTGTNHGTQVAQIVYDMAPQAQLYLAKVESDVELQQAVNDMVAAGVQVINHSVGWYGAAFYDGTGPICDAVNTAANNGVQWINSAGNDRLRHYLGMFTDSDGDLRHEFAAAQDYNTITLAANGNIQLILNWDAYPSTNIDYDLFLYNGNPEAGGTIVARSENRQGSLFPYPYEYLNYTASAAGTYYVVASKRRSSTTHLRLSLFSLGPDLATRTTASSLSQPADCANSLTVGATSLVDAAEGFSAEGPTTDGRAKPEVTGPDQVQTSIWTKFAGTSAAAPHVAGAVALLTAQLGLPSRQAGVRLLSTLKDVHTVGFDYRTGYGRVSLDADGDGDIHDADNCPLAVNADQADYDGDGLGDVCDDDADADGLSVAQEAAAGSNPLNPDTDGDALNDYDEVMVHGTSPLRMDTDSDGVTDYDELFVYSTDPLSPPILQGDIAPAGAPDGVINVADFLRLTRFISGLDLPTAQELSRADMNADGDLDVRDELALGRVLGY